MWIYILRRLFLLIPTIVGVMSITFLILSVLPQGELILSHYGPPPKNDPVGYSPTGPCTALHINRTGDCPNPLYERYAHALGLDRPIWYRWGIYIYNSFTFNWGYTDNFSYTSQVISFSKGHTVLYVLDSLLPYTLELAILSLLIVLVVAIPLGNLAAVNRNRPIDQISRVISFSGFALPHGI